MQRSTVLWIGLVLLLATGSFCCSSGLVHDLTKTNPCYTAVPVKLGQCTQDDLKQATIRLDARLDLEENTCQRSVWIVGVTGPKCDQFVVWNGIAGEDINYSITKLTMELTATGMVAAR